MRLRKNPEATLSGDTGDASESAMMSSMTYRNYCQNSLRGCRWSCATNRMTFIAAPISSPPPSDPREEPMSR
jgi:hypothetical protein